MACRFYFFVFLLDPYFQSVSTSSNQYLGLKLTSCPSDFFTAEILPVFFLFWFLWIRRHDWVSGYMMGRGTSRQIIPQLCSYNINTLITHMWLICASKSTFITRCDMRCLANGFCTTFDVCAQQFCYEESHFDVIYEGDMWTSQFLLYLPFTC